MVLFRAAYLLYFFETKEILDDFFFAKSIIGVVAIVSILFEIVYSSEINKFKDNLSFVKRFNILLTKLAIILSSAVITIGFFSFGFGSIFIHLCILSLWAIMNINSNYFLLIFRYNSKNTRVLLYYLLISIFDILLLISFIEWIPNLSLNSFIAISLSILISETIVFFAIFSKFFLKTFRIGRVHYFNEKLSFQMFFKVFIILLIIALIDITDKYFLSLLGDGSITYYVYGLKAPLIIRQSLDIKSNFFVQINKLNSVKKINKIFLSTIKKLTPFFILATILLVITVQLFEKNIVKLFNIEDYNLLKQIIYIGIIIVPFYMIWDLFYRFYYRKNMVNKLLIIALFGFIANIIFNYLFSFVFPFGIIGILISTLLVFLFYNIISYRNFF